jgi:outer membrane protein TolC
MAFSARQKLWVLTVAAPLVAALLSGCTSAHYRKSADKEVYRIIQNVEKQVFGHTNRFSIDTAYSGRKPTTVLPDELIASREATNRRTLSIVEALDLAATQSRRYQAEKDRLYLTALTLTGSRHEFSPQFFAGIRPTYERQENGDQKGSLGPTAGVSQMMKSGGRFGVNLVNDILRYYTGNPRSTAVSTFSANLVQPLLRGFGKNNSAVESLTQSERNVVYAVRSYSYFQNQFSVEIVNDYFALLAQKDVIRNRYTNYLGRVQSTQRLEARKDRERSLDVDQARQSELTAKNNYINSVASYFTTLDQFKIKLGLPLGERIFLDDGALSDLEKTGLVPASLNPEAAFRLAVEKQLLLLNAIDKLEDSTRKVAVVANRLKPDLNLFADAAISSERPTDYANFDPDKYSASAGLQLDLPIDRLNERNDYRTALVNFETAVRDFTLALDELKDSIDRGLRTLEQRRQNYEIQQNALELANRRVANTTLLLEAGRAEVRDLVDAQDSQINAENSLTAALVDYQQTRLQLMLDIGTLDADTPSFWLKDHLANAPTLRAPVAPPTNSQDMPVSPPELYFRN